MYLRINIVRYGLAPGYNLKVSVSVERMTKYWFRIRWRGKRGNTGDGALRSPRALLMVYVYASV